MSTDYNMICMDCGEVMRLGARSLGKHKKHWPEQVMFLMFDLQQDETYDDVAFLSHFLGRHLNHELRTFPNSTALTADTPVHEFLQWADPENEEMVKDFFNLPARLDDPDVQMQNLPKLVIDRLKEIHRKERLHDPAKPYNENPRYVVDKCN